MVSDEDRPIFLTRTAKDEKGVTRILQAVTAQGWEFVSMVWVSGSDDREGHFAVLLRLREPEK